MFLTIQNTVDQQLEFETHQHNRWRLKLFDCTVTTDMLQEWQGGWWLYEVKVVQMLLMSSFVSCISIHICMYLSQSQPKFSIVSSTSKIFSTRLYPRILQYKSHPGSIFLAHVHTILAGATLATFTRLLLAYPNIYNSSAFTFSLLRFARYVHHPFLSS